MIPKWQWAAIVLLIGLAAGLEIAIDTNSYAHAFLTGLCFHESRPAVCNMGFRRTAPRG